ncbi:hypothetical protein IQ07DRAFT_595265 [Pyrenochaeta sp. DS3sAY3a]|nr:hypothetical protein IQ07DRAFT_595265 [Pyrenochaeta sp. DS3sAY3a]
MTKRTHEEMGYGYDPDEEEDYISLDHTSTPAGNRIDLDLSEPEEDQILADVQTHWDREADSEDEGEFTGNESMPATQRYHDAVVVMVKKDFVINSVADRNTLSEVFELIKNDEHMRSEKRQSALKAILKGALGKMLHSESSRYHYYGRETEAAKRAEYEKLFRAVSQHCYSIGQGNLIDEMLQDLLLDDKWIQSKPLCDLIAQKVAQDVIGGSDSASYKWLTLPLPPVVTYPYVNGRRLFLESIKDALPDAAVPLFKPKMQQELERLLNAVNRFSDTEIQPLARIIENIPLSSYLELVLPKLDKLLGPTLVLQFLHSLLATQMSGKDHQTEIERTTLKFFMPRVISESNLSFDNLAIEPVTQEPQLFYRFQSNFSRPQMYEVPRATKLAPPVTHLLDSVGRCMNQGLEDEAVKLLSAALPSPTTLLARTLWKHCFMLIEELLQLLQIHRNPRLNQVASPFVSEVIQILARHLASTHPAQLPNWTPLSVSRTPCSCEPCGRVNQYLRDPKQIVGRFAYTQTIRKHLAKTFIHSGDLTFDTETKGSPHTLILQSKSKEYTHSVAVWEEEVQDMRSRLTAMGNDFVTSLLGADIVSISALDLAVQDAKANPATAQRFPLDVSLSSSNIQQPSARAGTKRKHDQVEVIDLT